jgi:hypothetical protein
MTFPDGRIKDGYFDNNVFKGNTHIMSPEPNQPPVTIQD